MFWLKELKGLLCFNNIYKESFIILNKKMVNKTLLILGLICIALYFVPPFLSFSLEPFDVWCLALGILLFLAGFIKTRN